jgi:hypothetical protein
VNKYTQKPGTSGIPRVAKAKNAAKKRAQHAANAQARAAQNSKPKGK